MSNETKLPMVKVELFGRTVLVAEPFVDGVRQSIERIERLLALLPNNTLPLFPHFDLAQLLWSMDDFDTPPELASAHFDRVHRLFYLLERIEEERSAFKYEREHIRILRSRDRSRVMRAHAYAEKLLTELEHDSLRQAASLGFTRRTGERRMFWFPHKLKDSLSEFVIDADDLLADWKKQDPRIASDLHGLMIGLWRLWHDATGEPPPMPKYDPLNETKDGPFLTFFKAPTADFGVPASFSNDACRHHIRVGISRGESQKKDQRHLGGMPALSCMEPAGNKKVQNGRQKRNTRRSRD